MSFGLRARLVPVVCSSSLPRSGGFWNERTFSITNSVRSPKGIVLSITSSADQTKLSIAPGAATWHIASDATVLASEAVTGMLLLPACSQMLLWTHSIWRKVFNATVHINIWARSARLQVIARLATRLAWLLTRWTTSFDFPRGLNFIHECNIHALDGERISERQIRKWTDVLIKIHYPLPYHFCWESKPHHTSCFLGFT